MMKFYSSILVQTLSVAGDQSTKIARQGILFGLAAYSIWGAFLLIGIEY
jgi:hypothetical protein